MLDRRYLASKLCTTDPMGGASADSEALIIQMMLGALRHDGYKSALVPLFLFCAGRGLAGQIRPNFMEHLEKQAVDAAMRARQSQSAQVLVRFLRCTGQDGAEPGHDSQQLARDLFTAKELLLRELVGLECYKQNSRNLNLHPALRMAQVIVMAGQDTTVVAMLEHMPQELQHMVKGIYSEQRNSRSMSESPVLHVPSGGGVRGLLQVLEDILTRARPNYLPSELYVSVSVSRADAAVKGTYRIDGSTPMPAANQAGNHQGLTYVKSVEHNVSYQIAKVRQLPPFPPPPSLPPNMSLPTCPAILTHGSDLSALCPFCLLRPLNPSASGAHLVVAGERLAGQGAAEARGACV